MKELSTIEVTAAGSKAVEDTIKYIQNTTEAAMGALGLESAVAYIMTVADIMERLAKPMKKTLEINRDEFLIRMGEKHDCENCPNSGKCPIENLINKAGRDHSV